VLLAAAAVRPLILNTQITLAQVDGDSGDHAAAIARLEALDVEGAAATQRAEVLGIQYARLALTTADPDARAAHLARSVEWFERAAAMFTGRSAKVPERLTHNLRYTRALHDGAAGDAVLPLLATLIEDPADPHLVAFAARVLSTVEPDPEQATAVVALLPRLLSALASALAPDDPGFRNLAEQIEASTRGRSK
jgi:hypothetical protein